jgi:hypothetical protein
MANQSHYCLSDRISVHHLDWPVLIPTAFSRTGWGQRSLISSELAHAFDLPPFIEWETHWQSMLVPLQLFRVILEHSLLEIVRFRAEAPSILRVTPSPSEHPALLSVVGEVQSSATYLPEIKKWLPGSWADAPIASKAVKADDATIDFTPWNRRISLVFPCPPLTIARMESLCLRLWRRTLTGSFRNYLVATYGTHWQHRLWTHLVHKPSKRSAGVLSAGADEDLTRRQMKRPCNAVTRHPWGASAVPRSMVGGITDRRTVGEVEKDKGEEVVEEVEDALELTELVKDVTLGRAVLRQVLAAAWWDRSGGSSLIFWRWNGKEQIQAARDGMRVFVQKPLPRGRKLKQLNLDAAQCKLVLNKLEGMQLKNYLEPGFVSNALHFFAVPKGDLDIRVVFDGTSSGLNETLWSPNFYLPTAKAASLNISFSSWMSDMDCGEMFHNFFMDQRIRKCAGLRMDRISKGGTTGNQKYLRWTRLFMGMRPSPYIAVRHYYWAEEFAKGNPDLKDNPMGFDQVILNLPGMPEYNPTLPKVMKWNSHAKAIAGDVITFVDDVRVTGFSKENCRNVHHQFASRLQFLGMQDAPRKYRPPFSNPGRSVDRHHFPHNQRHHFKIRDGGKVGKGKDHDQTLGGSGE